MITMKAPFGAAGCTVSHAGEEYTIDADGFVDVPNIAAPELRAHGFLTKGEHETLLMRAEARAGARRSTVEPDDDIVTDADLDPVDCMSKKELIAYLREKGIGISRGMTVGGLRSIVRDSIDEEVRAKGHEDAPADEPMPPARLPPPQQPPVTA